MKVLLMGASGATGKLLTPILLAKACELRIIVRPSSKVPNEWLAHANLTIIRAPISELTKEEMRHHIAGCDAVLSCLGHNLSFKGIYGKPRKLVTDAVKLCAESILANPEVNPVKFVLMNTAGNRNRGLKEPVSVAEKIVIGLLRALLPPHSDNENAAEYLRAVIGQNNRKLEWVVVRPDTLINEENASTYSVHPSPTSSAIFKPGKTSRIRTR